MTNIKEINKLNQPDGYHLYKDEGIFSIMQKGAHQNHVISFTPEQLETFLSDLNKVVA